MVDPAAREAIALLLLFWRLLPLPMAMMSDCAETAGWCRFTVWLNRTPGPDFLLCIIFAWTMRRPDYLPALLIAAVVLLEDMLLDRPPGLWTALVLLASEFVRGRVALTRELNFGVEWLLVSGLMVAMLLVYRMVFAMAMMPQTGFGFAMIQVVWSVMCYPVVVFLSRYVLDLHKPAMGEVDAYGRRM